MNKVMPEELKAFEASVSDTLRSYTHEHGPRLRQIFDVPPGKDLLFVVYSSFLGHTLDVVSRVMGREATLEMVRRVLDQVAVIDQTVAEAAKTGITLDPYAVSAVVVDQDPS